MESSPQSPDRVAHLHSDGSAPVAAAAEERTRVRRGMHHGIHEYAAQSDSIAAQVVEQAGELISAAENVIESRQQYSSVSEVASAGHPPPGTYMDRMGEFVPGQLHSSGEVVHGVGQAFVGGMYEGETDGGVVAEPVGGSNLYMDGENTNTPTATQGPVTQGIHWKEEVHGGMQGSPMVDVQHEKHGKRKNYEDGTESCGPNNAKGVHRVPSDMAMMTGLSDGENYESMPGGGHDVDDGRRDGDDGGNDHGGYIARDEIDDGQRRGTRDGPTDSNVGCILAGMGGGQTAGEVEIAQGVDRPSDADIIAWENQIREQQSKNIPLIGNLEPMHVLMEEYSRGSDIFKAKISGLSEEYDKLRRARGDGNCFFRSFIFAYLENLLLGNDTAERDRMTEALTNIQSALTDAGYEELVVEGPMELLLGMLGSVGNALDPLTVEILENNMRSEDISNYIVFLLRIITSSEVKKNANFFSPFVMGLTDMSIEEFCNRCVDPMGEESDHIQLVALTNALKVPVRVVYLDNSGMAPVPGTPTTGTNSVHADIHDFVPESCTADAIQIQLLYRPGHYDILYKRCSAAES